MKIVLIYLGRKGAGPEYAIEMVKALSKHAEVLCILSTFISNKTSWLALLQAGVPIQIKWIRTYNSILGFIFRSLNIFTYIDIIHAINTFQPKIIYSPMWHFWERFVVPYCKCNNTIRTIHDVILHEGENSFKYKFVDYFFSYKSSKYVILSSTFKNNLLQRGIKEDDILIIPHAVFKGYTSTTIARDYKQYDRFLFFGRIIKYKGLDILLTAMRDVIREIPHAKLVIAGTGDSFKQELIDECKSNLDLHIGWIEDCQVKYFFENIDFVVLPYIHASQSGVIPLAYSFGKPVIATRVGGIPEQVEEDKTGLLIKPNRIDELSKSICHLLGDPEKLKLMKKACYDYASINTWDNSAQILIDSFN